MTKADLKFNSQVNQENSQESVKKSKPSWNNVSKDDKENQIGSTKKDQQLLKIDESTKNSKTEIEMIKILRNRLLALMHLESNLPNIDGVCENFKSGKYQLMKDYFGFDLNESQLNHKSCQNRNQTILKEEFFKKVDNVITELERIETSELFQNLDSNQTDLFDDYNLPKALVSIKLSFPMVYVNRVSNYLNHKANDLNKQSKTSDKNQFCENLFTLSQKLNENHLNIVKMVEIIKESDSFDVSLV